MLDIINEKVIKSIQQIQTGSDLRKIEFNKTCKLIRQYFIDDPVFRLRFNSSFQYGYTTATEDKEMKPLHYLVSLLSEKLYKRDWIFPQLFCFHIYCDLENCDLIEIGGYSSSKVLNLFEFRSYIGTGLDDSVKLREMYKEDHLEPNWNFIQLDIQDSESTQKINPRSRIFSTACFEHILDLETSLQNCFDIMTETGYLYSYIAPIWTYPLGGQHGYTNKKFMPDLKDQYGFHLMQTRSQISKLKSMGFNKQEISSILSLLHFNDDVNQHGVEYYQRVLTESEFICLKFDEIQNLNISKVYPEIFKKIRAQMPTTKFTTLGIRTLLSKNLFPEHLRDTWNQGPTFNRPKS